MANSQKRANALHSTRTKALVPFEAISTNPLLLANAFVTLPPDTTEDLMEYTTWQQQEQANLQHYAKTL